MQEIAEFFKVSEDQYYKSLQDAIMYGTEIHKRSEYIPSEDNGTTSYGNIKIPARATSGSAGYDFVCPIYAEILPGESITIPTGIRCRMDAGWVLMVFPRSGLGFKYRMQLANTAGIIDSDYYNADNEGHIMVRITNDYKCNPYSFPSEDMYRIHLASKKLVLTPGMRFAQGVFLPYGITKGDNSDGIRTGGQGSTGK